MAESITWSMVLIGLARPTYSLKTPISRVCGRVPSDITWLRKIRRFPVLPSCSDGTDCALLRPPGAKRYLQIDWTCDSEVLEETQWENDVRRRLLIM